MTEAQLTGVQRAAVLLLSLGELDAAEVLRHMEPKEVQKIGIAMATMTDITREQVERVMDQFGQELLPLPLIRRVQGAALPAHPKPSLH